MEGSAKVIYDFLENQVRVAAEEAVSVKIFDYIYIWYLKNGYYALAREEGTFPLSIHPTIREALKAAFIRFRYDVAMVEKMGDKDDMPYYSEDGIAFAEVGTEHVCCLQELIDVSDLADDIPLRNQEDNMPADTNGINAEMLQGVLSNMFGLSEDVITDDVEVNEIDEE